MEQLKLYNSRLDAHNTQNCGFSIIEIMIAMAIGVMVISAAILVSFGNQSMVLSSTTNAEAVAKAQELIQWQEALARQDFNLVNPTSSTETMGGLTYTKTVSVTRSPQYLTKQVAAVVSWAGDHGQALSTTFTTFVSNLENVHAPTTCNSELSGDWAHPSRMDYDFGELVNNGHAVDGFLLSDIEVHAKKLYAIAYDTPAAFKSTFFIFDLENPLAPTLAARIDTSPTTGAPALQAITVASTSIEKVAFLANAYHANFKTCKPGPACSQLQVYDVQSATLGSATASTSVRLGTSTAPYVWANGGGGQAVGKSVFYKDGYLYLGLSTTGNGPGFHVIDVRTPLSPVWLGSWPAPSIAFGTSGAPINGIQVKGRYAYLSHPNGLVGGANEQLTILDVSDPANPVRVGGFSKPTGIGGNGKVTAQLGPLLYFGRTASNISGAADATNELYVLDVAHLASTPATFLGGTSLATADSINSLMVREHLAFVLTNKQFQVWDVSNPTSIRPWTHSGVMTEFLALPGGSGVAMDCEDNYFYVASHAPLGQEKDVLSVMHAGI